MSSKRVQHVVRKYSNEEHRKHPPSDLGWAQQCPESHRNERPPINLVMIGFYTFSPVIFHAYHLVQLSNWGGEYEFPDVIDLLIQSGWAIDANRLDGWWIDVGYSEIRDHAEEHLDDEQATSDSTSTSNSKSEKQVAEK